jgi:NCK-associated protein 1
MLNIIHSYTFMLLSIENYAHVDMTKAFNNVLLQQTNDFDQLGNKTLTNHYNEL